VAIDREEPLVPSVRDARRLRVAQSCVSTARGSSLGRSRLLSLARISPNRRLSGPLPIRRPTAHALEVVEHRARAAPASAYVRRASPLSPKLRKALEVMEYSNPTRCSSRGFEPAVARQESSSSKREQAT